MKTHRCYRMPAWVLVLLMLAATTGMVWAQSGSQGTISVTVVDPHGDLVPGSSLVLVQVETNDKHSAKTTGKGDFIFLNLPIGLYRLNVSKEGFATESLDQITVHAAQTTGLLVSLKIGKQNETVSVDASASNLIETSSNSIGEVIDLKYIEDLPLQGRDLSGLVSLTPGFAGLQGTGNEGLSLGNFNGQVEMDTSANIDGVIGSPSRGKYYGGNAAPAVTARIENVQEMSIQTDMMDVDQGYGQASMQVNYVTRSGTNKFHGSVFDDFRNSGLYANSWNNDAAKTAVSSAIRKPKLIMNDFGVSVGGPILRDKLFFFGNFSEQKVPGSSVVGATLLSSAAQAGNFGYTWTDNNGVTQTSTVNLYNLVNNYVQSATVYNTTPNAAVASELALVNAVNSYGTVTNNATDPNVQGLAWNNNNPSTTYFPDGRFDYNISPKLRAGLSWSMTQMRQPSAYAPQLPGPKFANETAGNFMRNFTTGVLVDWEATPTLINQFRGGFLYNNFIPGDFATPLYLTQPSVSWALGTSGQSYFLPVTMYYPLFNLSDTVSLQRKNHTAKFGFSWYREQDHYWNTPMGIDYQALGLVNGDAALNAFTNVAFPNASPGQIGEAESLYATLTGRISSVTGLYAYNPKTGNYDTGHSSYALDEVANAWSWYASDSWRITPTLTLNYGIRWDYTGDDHDISGAYHAWGSAGVFGPTAVGDLFDPGSLKGIADPTIAVTTHAYQPWHRSPQPQIGFAWNPDVTSGPFAKFLGGHSTVLRGGFSLKKFTEPQQFIWDYASDYGQFYFQNFWLYPSTSTSTGYFTAGSLALGDAIPTVGVSPASYVASENASALAFGGFPFTGMDPKIPQPYVETWNVGIQRQLGSSRAIEVRYNGNHSVHQWVSENPNEVNIFENGFLTEFKNAQANLAAYVTANPNCGQPGYPACNFGQGPNSLPIMTQSFQGEADGGPGVGLQDFTNSQFITFLQNGEAGALANVLSTTNGAAPYLCNLIGGNFTPCANNLGITGGGTQAINFWQANPYAANNYGTGYLTAAGYSNYDSLQVEFRQQSWKGLQLNANYAWSHTLGMSSQENWTGGASMLTLRKSLKRINNMPAEYDIRQVIHVNGTYDLPFGKGKQWLSSNNLASRLAGNWTIGNIITWQTGMPQHLSSGFQTFNDYADSGVVLSGVTRAQLQKAVHMHRLPAATQAANYANGVPNYVTMLDSKYLASAATGGANTTYIKPNTAAGALQSPLFLYGPHGFYHDVSISKSFPVWRDVKTIFQGEFLNVWNHPVFGNGNGFMDGGVQDAGFGTAGGPSNAARQIQARLKIEF